MEKILIISKRELQSYFDSLTAYILIVVFLGMSGFFTWLYGSDIFYIGQATLQPFFSVAYWTLFFFIPAITMRSIAEEKSSGTIELLLTKSISDWQIVIGKFLSSLYLVLISLALTLPYYITISMLGPVDHGAVWCGYLGMILLSSALIGIGVFASSLTNNQIVAFLSAVLCGFIFFYGFNFLSDFKLFKPLSIQKLGIYSHYSSISKGVLDTRDIIYFISLNVFKRTRDIIILSIYYWF